MSNQPARTFLDSVAGYANSTSSAPSSADKPVLIGTVDPYYTAGLVSVTFDGESAPSSKGYTWVSTYLPFRGDRVFLIPLGQSYIIGGKVTSSSAFVQYIPLTPQNGWGTFDTGSSPAWAPPRVTRTPTGLVKVSGLIAGGTITNGTTILTLPSRFCPLTSHNFLADSADQSIGLTVNTDGTIVLNGGSPSTTWLSLDTIIFNNDPSVTWNNSPLINGWATVNGNPPAQYAKDAIGRLWNRGVIVNPTTPTADQTIYVEPVGFRPDFQPHVANLSTGVFGFHTSNSAGNYTWKFGSGSTADFWVDQGVGIASGVGSWTNATMSNGWLNYDPNNYAPARYWKDPDGVVHLQGLIKGGTLGGATIFTLPVGMRPKLGLLYATASNNAFARCDIKADGTVAAAAGSATWYSLDGICFPAEQ